MRKKKLQRRLSALKLRMHSNYRLSSGIGSIASSTSPDFRREPEGVRAALAELMINILIDEDDSTRVLKVGSQFDIKKRKELVGFFRANQYVFAWTHFDVEYRRR